MGTTQPFSAAKGKEHNPRGTRTHLPWGKAFPINQIFLKEQNLEEHNISQE
jgi:hypothetical protein